MKYFYIEIELVTKEKLIYTYGTAEERDKIFDKTKGMNLDGLLIIGDSTIIPVCNIVKIQKSQGRRYI